MLMQAFRGSLTPQELVSMVLAALIVIFLAMPIHEYAHAFTANKLGDNTASYNGRLKFNPIAHIDPIGAICIILFGFGWAKPVPINPRNFKNPKKGMAISAFAGPLSNIIMALIGAFLLNLVYFILFKTGSLYSNIEIFGYINLFFSYFIQINVFLAVFNLLPIPPLDGSKILYAFIPDKYVYQISMYERQISMVLFLLLFIGPLGDLISFLSSFVIDGVAFLASAPFELFM